MQIEILSFDNLSKLQLLMSEKTKKSNFKAENHLYSIKEKIMTIIKT